LFVEKPDYFDAAAAAAEAAEPAEVAALWAAPAAADAALSAALGVAVAGAGAGAAAGAGAGGATTVSSFLLQATRANEATRVAIRSEFFILVLNQGVEQLRVIVGTLESSSAPTQGDETESVCDA
jgi:hypothetical protein